MSGTGVEVSSEPGAEATTPPISVSSRKTWQNVYDAVHAGAPPQVVRACVDRVDSTTSIQAWLAAREPVELIAVWGNHLEAAADRLQQIGLDPSCTRTAASDSFELSATFAEKLCDGSVARQLRQTGAEIAGKAALTPFFGLLLRLQGGFTRLVAGLGRACTACPFTGAMVVSQHAIPVALDASKQVCIFYRFRSVETFYVVVSSFSGGKEFLYLPVRRVLLRLHEPDFTWGEPTEMVAAFDRLSVEHAERLSTYFERDTHRAVLVGTTDNLGHFFWNDITGFDSYETEGLLRNVQTGLTYRHQQLDVFRLFGDRHVFERELYAGDQDVLLRTALEEGLFCFRPSSYMVSPAVAGRVLRHAEAVASEEQKEVAREARRAGHVIWVNFRQHNKVWLNFMEVMPRAIARLVQRYGTVAVLADGMPDCMEQGEELRRRLPEGATLYPGFDLPLTDSIHRLSAMDSYVATIGSGLTLLTWIAARPGIAHAELVHLGQMAFWGEVRPDAPRPLVPAPADIREIGNGMYCDYEVSEEAMLRLFDELATMVPPRVTT